MKKPWIDIFTILGTYAIMFAATYFMWLGAECVIEKAAHIGTVDVFFAAYFAWSMVRAMARVGKRVQEKSNERNIQV